MSVEALIAMVAAIMVALHPVAVTYEAPDPLVCVQREEVPWPTPEEFHWLARAVVGEVSVMGPDLRFEAGSLVVNVAYNRVPSPWFPDNLEDVVKEGFNGAWAWETEYPPGWAYAVVHEAVRLRYHHGEDPTEGSLFLFGGLDLVGCMDYSMRAVMLKREGYQFSVHAFVGWPYPEGCWYE